ncbi:YfiR family protein [Fulvivirga sp. M361]|uniref:YfiR family protein n=1 Tax=Fulvivirga sp. M361 TaxID=2594266 RepID=UPI00162A82B3|nr:YfiR family protein [Fulvivirga sp. M361]
MEKMIMVIMLVLTGSLTSIFGQSTERFEALFIYKFSDYIKWPDNKAKKTVGVLNNSMVLKELNKVSASSGKITAIQLDGLSKIEECDIVYVGETTDATLQQAVASAKSNHILLVTKGQKHVGKGSCIGFYTEGGRLKFAISPKNMAAYQLKASGTLTALGKIIE